MEQLSTYSDRFIDWTFVYGPKFIGAIVVFVLGLYVTNWLTRQITRGMNRRHLDVSLQSFLGSMYGMVTLTIRPYAPVADYWMFTSTFRKN